MKRALMSCVLALLLVLATVSPGNTLVVYCTNCSEMFTQALERVTNLSQLQTLVSQYQEAVTQTIEQIEMVANQVKQYQNMVQNTVKLPAQLINKVTGTFKQLASLTKSLQTQAGDIAAMGSIFTEIYGDSDFLKGIAKAGTGTTRTVNAQYQAKLEEWSSETQRASKAAFQVTGEQLDDLMNNAGDFDSHVSDLLSTPDGQMQALESANELAALQLKEARELRTLLVTSTQANIQDRMKAEKQDELRSTWWQEMTKTDKLQGISGKSPKADPF